MVKQLMKKKYNIYLIGLVFLFALFLAIVIRDVAGGSPMMKNPPEKIGVEGEYSIDGKNYINIEEMDGTIGLTSNIYFRGHFTQDVPKGQEIQLYLNHLFVTVCIKGQEVLNCMPENGKKVACGVRWKELISPGITGGDVVEIHILNPHSSESITAFQGLFYSMYLCSQYELHKYLGIYDLPYRILGFFVLAVSMLILGMAMVAKLTELPASRMLCRLGLFSLFSGAFIILDTADGPFVITDVALANDLTQLTVMLSGFEMCCCIAELLKTKVRELVENMIIVFGVIIGAFAAYCLMNHTTLCSMNEYWIVAQTLFCIIMFCCGIYEVYVQETKLTNSLFLISCFMMLLAALLDILDVYSELWMQHICSKAVFLTLFIIYIIQAVRLVPASIGAEAKARELERQLEDNKISVMMSQIQPHFLYNSLGAIRELCISDPRAAEQAIGEFAVFLRCNMNSLTMDKPIPFEDELNHTKNYLKLEEMGFGERLNVKFDIETMDFAMPTLTLQPVVENAIRHGIEPKDGGGTVRITVKDEGECISITVSDDGVGFDPSVPPPDTKRKHVGMQNVRERLRRMCGGTLEIRSAPGEGTTAVIRIPKEK